MAFETVVFMIKKRYFIYRYTDEIHTDWRFDRS